MAKVGLCYAAYAPISAYTSGSAITYGTGSKIGEPVTTNFNWNRSNAELYAGDALCESDNTLVSGTVAVEIDDLSLATEAGLGLTKEVTGTGSTTTYKTVGKEAAMVGFGCVADIVKSGTHKYRAKWLHRVQFSKPSDENGTKGESIEFRTTSLEGKILGAVLSSGGDNEFQEEQEFTTKAAAIAWINTKAGITTTGG